MLIYRQSKLAYSHAMPDTEDKECGAIRQSGNIVGRVNTGDERAPMNYHWRGFHEFQRAVKGAVIVIECDMRPPLRRVTNRVVSKLMLELITAICEPQLGTEIRGITLCCVCPHGRYWR